MTIRKLTVFITLALLIAVFALPASAAPRQCVILEGFTQWNCGPCAGWNPSETSLMNQMTRDTVISVKYHGWWPGANNDPFFLWNSTENTARINMYGVNAVPDTRLDGYLTPPRNVTTLRNMIRNEYAMDCPCTISISALTQGEDQVLAVGSVTAEDDEDLTGLRLFVALLTNEEHAPPQGSNGETAWYDVFRDLAPNASTGYVLSAAVGQSEPFEFNLNRDADWEVENLHVVAWVQDMSNDQVVQGAHAAVTQDYGFTTTTTETPQQMVDITGGEVTYTVNLLNVGNLSDTYAVELNGDFPAGWSYTVEADGVSPHESTINVPLESLDDTDLIVRIDPNGNPGFVDFAVEVSTPNEPVLGSSDEFRIMGGLDILLVDDDEGESFETYFMEALAPYAANTEMVHGVWELDMGSLDNSSLENVDIVVWMTGSSFIDGHTLTVLDQLMLGDYLTAGGALFLSGQGIGFDIRTDQFMSEFLHAQYLRNWPQGQTLVAVEGDPISDGLDASLDGGSGADNQNRQSALNALDDNATVIYHYEEEGTQGEIYGAAVRSQGPAWPSGNYGVVYLGFGLESIADEQTRIDLMANSLDWLRGATPVPDNENPVNLPHSFALGQNYPNPFNPETTIPFSLPARADVSLTVYDILGRQVADLASGTFDAGSHSVNWNPTELSSGIYFYSIKAVAGENTFRDTRKLVLMK